MVVVQLVVAGIIAIVGVVLIGIATAITGIISTQKEGDTKTRLLASAGISGFTAIVAIIAAILGLLYGGRAIAASADPTGSQTKKAKTLFIIFLIAIIIVFLMYATVIGLNLSLRARSDELDGTQQNSMTAGIVLAGVGLLLLIIATIIIFVFAKSKLPKGFKSARQLQTGIIA